LFGRVATLHEEALALWRALRDRRGIADSLFNLGHMARRQGDYGRAAALFEETPAQEEASTRAPVGSTASSPASGVTAR
jgi:hypothetical protein